MFWPSDHFYPSFREAVRKALHSDGVVLDVGTDRRFRKHLAPFRQEVGPRTRYFALGYRADGSLSLGEVDIVGDAMRLPFESDGAIAILCIDVLEHVFSPERAVSEFWRVLKPGGLLVATLPFLLPFHGGSYPDLWRFTEEGVRRLFRSFDRVEVSRMGGAVATLRNYLGRRLILCTAARGLTSLFNAMDRMIPTGATTPVWLVTAVRPEAGGRRTEP